MRKSYIAAAMAATVISTTAMAAVTGNATSGWYVGKGDVQSAFGWNNATLQENWNDGEISFRYDSSSEYEVTCEWDTINKKQTIHHNVTSTISRGLSATLEYGVKQKNQISGFNVGAAGTDTGGSVPSVNDSCGDYEDVDGNANDGVITSVTPLGSSGGGLYVVWEGQEVLLQAAS